MEVSVILNRREHWVWESRDFDVDMKRWYREYDPLLIYWFAIRQKSFRPKSVKIHYKRALQESYVRFYDIKEARHFALEWNIPREHIFVGEFNEMIANKRLVYRP
jgi:hypothetical protein